MKPDLYHIRIKIICLGYIEYEDKSDQFRPMHVFSGPGSEFVLGHCFSMLCHVSLRICEVFDLLVECLRKVA